MLNKANRRPVDLGVKEANWLKGILILFVLFDHNDYLREVWPNFFRPLIFHVVGFFVLSFPGSFYSKKKFYEFFFERLCRYFVPFIFFYVFYALVGFLASTNKIHFDDFYLGIAIGSFELVKLGCGGAFMWFLPALFGFSILMKLMSKLSKNGLIFWIVVGALFYYFTAEIAYILKKFVPFGLGVAFYIIPIIFSFYMLQYILEKYSDACKSRFLIAIAFVCVGAYGFLIKARVNIELGALTSPSIYRPDLILSSFLSTVFILLVFWSLANVRIIRFEWIATLGSCSLIVYLTHPLFLAIFGRLASALGIGSRDEVILFLLGLVSTTFAIVFSLGVASAFGKAPMLQALIFPRDFDHFLSAWSRKP